MQNPPILTERRSRGQVIDFFTKKSKTCPSDLNENDQKNRPHDLHCRNYTSNPTKRASYSEISGSLFPISGTYLTITNPYLVIRDLYCI